MQVIVGCLEFIVSALVYLMVCGYFAFIDKNWLYLQVPTLGFAALGIILVYFQPESPRFLVSKGRYDEAREVYSRIARINGKGHNFAQFFVFKDEVENQQMINDPYGQGLDKDKPIKAGKWTVNTSSLRELVKDR